MKFHRAMFAATEDNNDAVRSGAGVARAEYIYADKSITGICVANK